MDWIALGENLIVIFVSILVWYSISGLFHMFLHMINSWEKIVYKIKRPKPKRYLTKVDPIYEMRECTWESGVSIHKWSLRYDVNLWIQFLLIFIPYPIEIMYWRYRHENSIYLCKKDEVVNLTEDLSKLYEDKMAPSIKEWEETKRKRKEQDNKIDELNQIFKQNYE